MSYYSRCSHCNK